MSPKMILQKRWSFIKGVQYLNMSREQFPCEGGLKTKGRLYTGGVLCHSDCKMIGLIVISSTSIFNQFRAHIKHNSLI